MCAPCGRYVHPAENHQCHQGERDRQGVGSALTEERATVSEDLVNQEVNEPVLMRESVKPFQMEILEGKTKTLLWESTHVMVAPLKAGEAWQSGARPLPPARSPCIHKAKDGQQQGISCSAEHVQQPHLSQEGVQITHVVSAMLSLEMEATLEAEIQQEPMSVLAHQERLPEKLNLDGLSN